MTTESVPVLVAGAGPTGLALATALWHKGIRCRVVDPHEGRDGDPSRAVTIHAGTLEGLDAIGAAVRLVERGTRITLSEIRRGDRVLVRNDFSRLPSRFNLMLSLPQRETEATLRERLEELGGEVDDGWRVDGFRQDETGVDVGLLGPGGARRSVHAGVLVGCDGAHSTVRDLLGVGFDGAPYAETFVLADLDLSGPVARDRHTLWVAEAGPMLFVPLPGGQTRLGAMCDAEPPRDDDALGALIRERSGSVAYRIEALGILSDLRVQRRHTDRMQVGRVFLAGDAAHVHTPMGALGMNGGIRDALDLAAVLVPGIESDRMPTATDYEVPAMARARRNTGMADRMQRVVTARGAKGRLLRSAAWTLSRFPPSHDRIIRSVAGIA